jgi:hypothetical protein
MRFLFKLPKLLESVCLSKRDESVYSVWVVFRLPVTKSAAIELEHLIGEAVANLDCVSRVVVELRQD